MKKGKFVIITGPSAVGKTDAVKSLLERTLNTGRLITTTTREPRDGEIDGVDYYFISQKRFLEEKDGEGFLETANNYGNFYGSSREKVEEMLLVHSVVFGILDVKGAHIIKEKMPEAIVIFLAPGSLNDIIRRLNNRAGVKQEEKEKRIEEAVVELLSASMFDHTVKNIEGKFEETVKKIIDILLKIT